jgi:hypothetical protein
LFVKVCVGGDRGLFLNVYTLITLVLIPLIILCSNNMSRFILSVRSRARTINPLRNAHKSGSLFQGQTQTVTLFQSQPDNIRGNEERKANI